MIPEIGHFALILALGLALCQAVIPLVGAHRNDAAMMATARPAALGQFFFVAVSFVCLTWSFVQSDFSVLYVANHSQLALPTIYKISAVWGAHEGSLLLWVLMLALWTVLVGRYSRELPDLFSSRVIGVLGLLSIGFLLFTLMTSNPFERLIPAAADGADLNPLLQDPGLAIHPPLLYMGYVGFSVAFAFAIAAMISGNLDQKWARWTRPWTTWAWLFLTIGIALGSWWAYYELGWGGWWFWDPVQNASFMPWLVSAALLHSAIVVEKRNALKAWTILLAILAFSLSLIGTFIVRSGVITSVHAFATDPERGVFILGILLIAIFGSLVLFAWRAPIMKSEGVFRPVSREGALILNNLLLAVATAVVFIGTLAPLVREFIDGSKISVGAPFFDLTFTPFMVILFLALPLGALLPWKRGDGLRVIARLWWAAAIALVAGCLVLAYQTVAMGGEGGALAPIGLALAAWLIFGVIVELWERGGFMKVPASTAFRRLAGLPRADWGKAIAHAGLGLTVMGIAAVSAWEIEDIRLAKPGDKIPLGSYEVHFDGIETLPLGAAFNAVTCGNASSALKGDDERNFETTIGRFRLMRDNELVAIMCPEKRFYPVQQMPTTEAAIDAGLTRDVYLVLGDQQQGTGAWAVRSYYKPLANWIWIGTFVMAFGGLISLTDRRFRVGAAARRQKIPAAVPAE